MKAPEYGLALCALGLEKVCQNELERLGLKAAGREAGRVRFALGTEGAAVIGGAAGIGCAASLMRANLCLRSAERVLIEAGRFRALDFDQLFESARALPWELYFRREDRLVIERVRIKDSRLAAQTSVQSIVHKAIYERLCEVYKIVRMPETGRERSLRVYLDSDDCLLGLDSSGEALHKRGYRLAVGQAPLKETVASGILLLSGWSRRHPLLDTFCGSGTIAVEAALFAMDRAPGLGRAFSLEDMPLAFGAAGASMSGQARGAAPAMGINDEIEAAKARVRRDAEFRIIGSDADPGAIEAAKANAARAGVAAGIEFRVAKAEDARPEYESGYLLCNPPYGERLGSVEEAEALYGRLGEIVGRFSGWGLGFVTNRADFGDFFGYEASRQYKVINGSEEQWFHWYPPNEALSRVGERTGAGADSSRGRRGPTPGKERSAESPKSGRPPKPRLGRPWIGPDKPGWKGSPSKEAGPPKDPRRAGAGARSKGPMNPHRRSG